MCKSRVWNVKSSRLAKLSNRWNIWKIVQFAVEDWKQLLMSLIRGEWGKFKNQNKYVISLR